MNCGEAAKLDEAKLGGGEFKIYRYKSGFLNMTYVVLIGGVVGLVGIMTWGLWASGLWASFFSQTPINVIAGLSLLPTMSLIGTVYVYFLYRPIGINEQGVVTFLRGRQRKFIAWKDVQRIEKIRSYDNLFNRYVNEYSIRSATTRIFFSEWIHDLPDLVVTINRYIVEYRIPAFFVDRGRDTLRTLAQATTSKAERQKIRREGGVRTPVNSL